jgi:hypothetical protein
LVAGCGAVVIAAAIVVGVRFARFPVVIRIEVVGVAGVAVEYGLGLFLRVEVLAI